MYIYVYMYVIFKRNNCKKRATKVPKRIQPSGFNLCIISHPSDSFGPFLLDLINHGLMVMIYHPMVQSVKNTKKTRKNPVFGSSLKKKSHPTPGGYSKWLDDFLPRCYRNWRLQPVLGQESPGKLSTKSDSKTIRVWDLIIEAFLLEKNWEKQNISNEQNQIQASQVSKKWDVPITFLNNRIQKREMFISLLSTFCHLFWTHF